MTHLLHLTQCLLLVLTGDLQNVQYFSALSSSSIAILGRNYDLSKVVRKRVTILSVGLDLDRPYPTKITRNCVRVYIIAAAICNSWFSEGIVIEHTTEILNICSVQLKI